jgi:hypothetical protein
MHVMLDLETMGTGNTAAIVAIGAVAFDGEGVTMNPFYCAVDLRTSVELGMQLDVATVLWWVQQSDGARESTFPAHAIPLPQALLGFSEWMGAVNGKEVWGNGATFDNVILRNAYALVQATQKERMGSVGRFECPWSFRNDRCYRTMRAMLPAVDTVAVGVAHNALDDAIYQAKYLIEACKMGGVKL